MCGIFGFSFQDEKLAETMAATLRHRGSDDHGVFSDGNATLGHQRLSILDLSAAGHQPMSDKEGKIWISYNGEIYNFKELKKELEKQGYVFKSQTDTEVILYGYKEYGADFFKKMRGMWAFAIYDVLKEELVLSRDFFGIKPLYYSLRGRDLIFASEMRALGAKLSSFGAMSYFVLGYAPHPWTVFENIKKVNPGEVLIFNLKNKSLSPLQMNLPDTLGAEAPSDPHAFESVMLESVEKHLIADVPVGIFLSGGVDSSLLALMLKKLGKSPKAFTVRSASKKDADFAKKIADFAGLDYLEILMGEEDFEEMYSRLFETLDEPIADTALFPTMLVAKEASRHVKVVMTGEGGDELFWGYERYQNLLGLNKAGGDYPSFFSRPDNIFYLNYIKPILRRLRLAYFGAGRNLPGTYLDYVAIDSDFCEKKEIYDHLATEPWQLPSEEKMPPSFFDEKYYLPDNLLKKTDFATMSYSIEGRVPFLDREVYKFAKNLAPDQKLAGGIGKKLLKECLASNLPQELIFRRKEGFSLSPQIYIFKNHKAEIKEAIKYILSLKFNFISERALLRALQDEAYFEFILSKFPQTVFSWLAFYKVLSRYNLN